MIFGKDKKNTNSEVEERPLESAAINRWKNINSSSASLTSDTTNESTEEPAIENQRVEETEENVQIIALNQVFEEEEKVVRYQEEDELEVTPIHAQVEVKVEPPPAPRKPKTPPLEKANLRISTEEDLKRRFGDNIQSALGSGTMIEGRFSFETPVRIDGSMKGEIKSSSALIVGKNANVNANIKVGALIVLGNVEGEIEAEDLIEIRSSGVLLGDIITKRIALEEGGVFSGSCTMID